MTPVDSLDAEKTLEPVFLYAFRIAFRASLFRVGVGGDGLKEKTLKGFINLRFLHKLYWMKTEWDQARLSGLV